MRTAILVISVGVLSLANSLSALLPELKPVAEDGGQLVIKWEMGDAAFVDLQRLAEEASSDRLPLVTTLILALQNSDM